MNNIQNLRTPQEGKRNKKKENFRLREQEPGAKVCVWGGGLSREWQ